jgi:HEAT repeat protein
MDLIRLLIGCLIVLPTSLHAPQHSTWRGKTEGQWIEQLSDKDINARWYATHALGEMGQGSAAAVEALSKILENPQENEYIRGGAAWAIGRMPEAAVPAVPLLARLFVSQHISVRRNSALALGNIGPAAKSAVPALLKALDDQDPTVRVNAAVALWKIDRRPEAVPKLVEMLRKDTEPGAFEAAVALGDLDANAETVSQALTEAKKSSDADVRRAAARSLSQVLHERHPGHQQGHVE